VASEAPHRLRPSLLMKSAQNYDRHPEARAA
jgi:hypothetical protein